MELPGLSNIWVPPIWPYHMLAAGIKKPGGRVRWRAPI
jgi:hypothetical protein